MRAGLTVKRPSAYSAAVAGFLYHMLQPPVKRPAWVRLAVVAGSLAFAFGLRAYLEPWLRWHSPFALLLPAVLVSAWFGGARAGLLATVIGGIGTLYVFILPPELAMDDASDAVAFLLFLMEGIVLSILCEVLHRAVARTHSSAAEAAHKFEVMANSAPVLIWSTDANGHCVFANRTWLAFTGHPGREHLAEAWIAHIHPDDRASHRHTFAEALAHHRTYQFEYRLRHADGSYRWLLEHAIPRRDADGRFEGFIGSCTDITTSRREREDLDFVARLQRSLGTSLDLQRVATALADAAVPALADHFCLELAPEQGPLELLWPPAFRQPVDDSTALTNLRPAQAVLETAEAQFAPRADLAQLLGPAPDPVRQRSLQALGLISHVAVPLFARGRIIGILTLATGRSGRTLGAEELALGQKIAGFAGFAIDNARLHQHTVRALADTEQARHRAAASEGELGRQRLLLKTIIDAVPALVAYVGPDGHVLVHNEKYREWLGRADPAITGRPLAEASAADGPERTAAHVRAALRGETVSYEERLQAGGTEREVAVTLRPDPDDHGRVRGAVFHAYDVTERNRAYADLAAARELLRGHADVLEARVHERTASLRELNAELEAFTYSVSHDLRTPLQFIRRYAEAIGHDDENELGAESRAHLNRIISAAVRMDVIIHDLLGYSRLGRGDVALAPRSLDEAVAETIAQQQAVTQRLGAQIIVESPLPPVLADDAGLFQILSNLISNALKFTSTGRAPMIRLRAEKRDAFVRLWVIDNGIGIHERHHGKIFQLFERGPDTTAYPGTGLGLALVRKAASRMGGRCGLESAPGSGSRFWVDFPAAPASGDSSTPIPPAISPVRPARNRLAAPNPSGPPRMPV
jgi:PAS domain S-box-containing protein